MSTSPVATESRVAIRTSCPGLKALPTTPTGVERGTKFSYDFERFFQVTATFFRPGVVDRDDEVGGGGGFEALLDPVPGSKQVAQADGGEIVHERRAEQGPQPPLKAATPGTTSKGISSSRSSASRISSNSPAIA